MKKYFYMTNACKNCCKTGNSMSKHIKLLEKENSRLIKTLMKYADEENWVPATYVGVNNVFQRLTSKCGYELAQKILEGIE